MAEGTEEDDDQLPGEQSRGEQYPGEQYPGEQYPGEQYPGEQYPGESSACESTTRASPTDESSQEVPPPVVDEVEQLTRKARQAVDDRAREAYRARRERVLDEFEFRARVREDDRDTLVLYPDEWVEDGTVRPERVDDVDRGIQRPLEGAGDPDDWEVLYERNLAVAQRVRESHGEVHGDTARALAEFMSNHFAKPIAAATDQELTEFVEDYFPRNAWPSDEQREQVETSLAYAVECADASQRDG